VLLAAGLDTRARRLAWPQGMRVFEVGLPDVLAFKDSVLARPPPPAVRFVQDPQLGELYLVGRDDVHQYRCQHAVPGVLGGQQVTAMRPVWTCATSRSNAALPRTSG
jgi:hypothetical protein